MPTPPKALDAMAKHLTAEEIEKIQAAESSVIPDRGEVQLIKPKWLSKAKGGTYWDSILDRMQGTAILVTKTGSIPWSGAPTWVSMIW